MRCNVILKRLITDAHAQLLKRLNLLYNLYNKNNRCAVMLFQKVKYTTLCL